jgi:aminobenzoyl-glutamate utilization protein B
VQKGLRWIDEKAAELSALSKTIWNYAEVGLREEKSAAALAEYLEKEGFSLNKGVGNMPSAFVASFGEGKPILGFLGEYDSLAGLSQKISPTREEVVPGGPGHGCGHNLLGVGSLGAAVALKKEIEGGRVKGTVRFYACPAEETLIGKVFMAKAGVFNDLDAAITWHPWVYNGIWGSRHLAMNSVRFAFHGRTAHAASAPHMGISALDAVELMNVGVNFLREHVIQEARIHYVITNGGGQPNVVPAQAEAWYYVRAPHRYQVEEIYPRILKIAEGASLMTGARLEIKFQVGCYNYLPNRVMSDLLFDCFRRVGAPQFSPEDIAFAKAIEQSFGPGHKLSVLTANNIPAEYADLTLHQEVAPIFDWGKPMPGSTDVGDVSWITPTAQLTGATWVMGTAAHSWQATAASGMGIGQKAMIAVSKAMAVGGYELMTNPDLLRKAKETFAKDTDGKPYVSPLPPEMKAPLMQL